MNCSENEANKFSSKSQYSSRAQNVASVQEWQTKWSIVQFCLFSVDLNFWKKKQLNAIILWVCRGRWSWQNSTNVIHILTISDCWYSLEIGNKLILTNKWNARNLKTAKSLYVLRLTHKLDHPQMNKLTDIWISQCCESLNATSHFKSNSWYSEITLECNTTGLSFSIHNWHVWTSPW